MTPHIKIITGYRKDQEHSIDAQEAHKAYYLFLNPDKRGIFKGGLAIRGEDIKAIEPDYNASMGWPPTYRPDDFDWAEIEKQGLSGKIKRMMEYARNVAIQDPSKINLPLSDVKKLLSPSTLALKAK